MEPAERITIMKLKDELEKLKVSLNTSPQRNKSPRLYQLHVINANEKKKKTRSTYVHVKRTESRSPTRTVKK